ncbi:MAG: hypothetical protein DRJ43_01150 [Thermoprotei archaeon]|nr:MAG: hypothetical protein DRJ43_01150 [Thermoprotei archaeon]
MFVEVEEFIRLLMSEFKRVILEFIAALAQTVPRLLLASVVLVVGWLLGRMAGRLVALLLKYSGVEKAFADTSVGRGLRKSGLSISELFNLLTRFSIYILSLGIAIRTLGFEEAVAAAQNLLRLVGQVVSSGVIFIVGLLVVEKVMAIIRRIVAEEGVEARVMTLAVHALLVLLVVFAAISQLDPTLNPASTFFNAFAWGLGLGMGVAVVVLTLIAFREDVEKLVSRLKEYGRALRSCKEEGGAATPP